MSTITEQDYRELKEEVEEAQAAAERAKGAHDQLLSQLNTEFGCKDLKSAQKLLDELTVKRDKARKQFEAAFEDYQDKWKDK